MAISAKPKRLPVGVATQTAKFLCISQFQLLLRSLTCFAAPEK
jgi:hypothetical protein